MGSKATGAAVRQETLSDFQELVNPFEEAPEEQSWPSRRVVRFNFRPGSIVAGTGRPADR